jgi:hypothetical protein
MSTSLLYHGFAVRGYEYVRTDYQEGQVVFTIRQTSGKLACPACRSHDVRPKGHVKREFRNLPIGLKRSRVIFPIPRVECKTCGLVRQVKIEFADPRLSYTKAYEKKRGAPGPFPMVKGPQARLGRYGAATRKCASGLFLARRRAVGWRQLGGFLG